MSERNLLMIPGPIEFEPAVLQAMSRTTPSHVSAEFVEIFGETLENLRQVFLTDDGQPFVIAGSGTLAYPGIHCGRRDGRGYSEAQRPAPG